MSRTVLARSASGSVFCEAFGQLHQQAPVARILDFLECNDEPQTLNHSQIDLMIPKQLH